MSIPEPQAVARRPPAADATRVQTKAGRSLWVRPCYITPAAILGGALTPYQEATLRLRNAWARSALHRTPLDVPAALWEAVALGAIQDGYEADRDTINAWLGEDDQDALVAVCAAASGKLEDQAGADMRRRALAAACVGLSAVPLTAMDLAMVADWSMNAGNAPGV
jgi:hypothetical protein